MSISFVWLYCSTWIVFLRGNTRKKGNTLSVFRVCSYCPCPRPTAGSMCLSGWLENAANQILCYCTEQSRADNNKGRVFARPLLHLSRGLIFFWLFWSYIFSQIDQPLVVVKHCTGRSLSWHCVKILGRGPTASDSGQQRQKMSLKCWHYRHAAKSG